MIKESRKAVGYEVTDLAYPGIMTQAVNRSALPAARHNGDYPSKKEVVASIAGAFETNTALNEAEVTRITRNMRDNLLVYFADTLAGQLRPHTKGGPRVAPGQIEKVIFHRNAHYMDDRYPDAFFGLAKTVSTRLEESRRFTLDLSRVRDYVR